jgi:hypothetical protein
MVSSGLLRHVALVRIDVSKERRESIIRVTRIGELRTTLAVTSKLRRNTTVLYYSSFLVTLMMEALRSSETSVPTRATRHNNQKTTFFIVIAVKTSNVT